MSIQLFYHMPKKLLKYTLLALFLFFVAGFSLARPAGAATFRITYVDGANEGFNDPALGAARRRAFQAAANVWGGLLAGSIPIEVEAEFNSLGGSPTRATLGQAGAASVLRDWSNPPAPVANTFYAIAVANQLGNRDFSPGNPDITAEFNSDVDNQTVLGSKDFYYGTDGRPPNDDVDFFSVCLHELGHGLGFFDLMNSDGSFAVGVPGIYDRFLTPSTSANGTRLPDMSQSERASALISENLFFAGPNTRAAGGGSNARIYAPNPYESGSSTSHLDEATYTGINELMTPLSSGVAHSPGPVALGVFKDIGWAGAATNPTPTPTSTTSPTPTPTSTTSPTPTPTATTAPEPTPTVPANRPYNDDFVKAQVVRNSIGSFTGSNVNATRETGEPLHAGQNSSRSVWYTWTSPAFGNVTFSTAGSGFDTILAAYIGTRVDGLREIASNDDVSGTDNSSSITFNAYAGLVFYIAVDGYSNAEGSFKLSWQQDVIAPPNDRLLGGQIIVGDFGTKTGSNIRATREAGEPNHAGFTGGKSVWFRWTAPNSGIYNFSTAGSIFDTLLAVYIGDTPSTLRLIESNDNATGVFTSALSFRAVAGTTYRIAVDGKGGVQGNLVLGWGRSPVNDDFVSPVILRTTTGSIRGLNAGATREVGEPNHATFIGGKSVWYRWTAPANGQMVLSTTGSYFNTLLAVYTGSSVATLRRFTFSNDVSLFDNSSRVAFNVTRNTTYQIAIDGFNGDQGIFLLHWRFTPAATQVAQSRLSTGTASIATDTVRLHFETILNGAAADAGLYSVKVNGVAVAVEAAITTDGDRVVALALPPGSLHLGDQVTVSWDGVPALNGRSLQGQTELVAR